MYLVCVRHWVWVETEDLTIMNQKPGKAAYEIYSLITFIDVNFFHFERCYEL